MPYLASVPFDRTTYSTNYHTVELLGLSGISKGRHTVPREQLRTIPWPAIAQVSRSPSR